MNDRWLALPAFTVAAVCAVVIAVSAFVPLIHGGLVEPLTYVAGVVAIMLFVRLVLDPKIRRGIDAANIEMRGGRPWPGMNRAFFDRDWGLFGSRLGSRPLLALRAILLVEFVLAMMLSGRKGSDLLALSFVALMIAMLLGLMRVGLGMRAAGP